MSVGTSNGYFRAIRTFCRWMLRSRRASQDPLVGMSCIKVTDANRTRKRRPLTDAEAKALIETTRKSPEFFMGLSGPDRAMLYLVAINTGLHPRRDGRPGQRCREPATSGRRSPEEGRAGRAWRPRGRREQLGIATRTRPSGHRHAGGAVSAWNRRPTEARPPPESPSPINPRAIVVAVPESSTRLLAVGARPREIPQILGPVSRGTGFLVEGQRADLSVSGCSP